MANDDTINLDVTIDDIFRIAIKREAQASLFYVEAATRVQAKETREGLLRLAREEAGHEASLRREWEILQAKRDVEQAMSSDL